MSSIRDLHFFIFLIVLPLFVLQGVDTECMKDLKNIKEIIQDSIEVVSFKK